MKKLISLFLIFSMALCLVSCAGKPEIIPVSSPLNMLRVNGDGYLTDGSGIIQLRGVNFGGWLLQETWMCPVISLDKTVTVKDGEDDGWANLDTLEAFESRFGKEKTAELFRSYQDNYITESDFKNVKNLGFNCIRIPFWYRNFMADENGTYITENDNDNPGFIKLNWACRMAEKYGVYLIFDMHGCPGGQSGDHSCGKSGRNYLYNSEKYQQIMENLWVKIAERYKDRACIAAYDIMNEPLNNADSSHGVSAENAADPWQDTTLRVAVYDRMIKAIRAVDPEHIITVEAIWRLDKLPDPSKMGWTNMMYQLHSYDSDEKTVKELVKSLEKARKRYKVAAYMGEFNPAIFYSGSVSMMDKSLISYTMWNYKTTSYGESAWGFYNKVLTLSDIAALCSEAARDKIMKQADEKIYSLEELTDSELLSLYEKLWSSELLSTDSYTLNQSAAELLGCNTL